MPSLRRYTRPLRKAVSRPLLAAGLFAMPWVVRGWSLLVWPTCRKRARGLVELDAELAKGHGVALAIYHESAFPAVLIARGRPLLTVASRSDSGEMIARIIEHFGMDVVRGGSSRSRSRRAPAVQQVIEAMQQRPRTLAALTVDGSSGPRRRAKPGVLEVARATGSPIYLAHVHASPCLRLPTWDRTILPLPFSRVTTLITGPMSVPPRPTAAQFDALKAELQRRLDETVAEAEGGVEEGRRGRS
ncbi:MAG: DUF374 domain-containing protein [Planctomycetes bacterium]|nr:DUF374 domain-containing protein [Planctomycetota bacterium]